MFNWLLQQAGNFGDLIALSGVLSGGAFWFARMILTGKKRAEAVFEAQAALQNSVNSIVEQMKPNGGSSIFDMVKQVAKQNQEQAAAISTLSSNVDRIRAYQWSFAETIADKPVWESDPKGNCLKVNMALARLTERTPAEFVNSGWENIIHPDDRSRVFHEWTDAVSRKRTFESNYKVKSRTGKVFEVKAIALPIFTEAQDVVAYIGRYDEVKELNG